jgi:hypothetical protein
MASRRVIRLELHEHTVSCPHCEAAILFMSPQQVLTLTDRTCPKCSKPFLITLWKDADHDITPSEAERCFPFS